MAQKLAKLFVAASTKTLRYIGHHRNGGSADLVAQSKIAGKRAFGSQAIDLLRKLTSILPSFNVLKLLEGRHGSTLNLER
jgi:hypothetical protein